jgi:hypothetical protein
MTLPELRRAYASARADWYATKHDPNSPRHHAALIAADQAAHEYAARVYEARKAAR